MKLIWQSPTLFFRSGLYLKVGNTRYCLLPLWWFL